MGLGLPGTRVRKRLVAIILSILSYAAFGLEMEILPSTLISGRIITLKIQTEISDTDEIQVSNIVPAR